MGGHKSTSVVEQNCGAGISGRLALRSRSILPCREDQECHHPVSGAVSPPQMQHDFGCSLFPARGTRQTSKCAGLGVVKIRENYSGKSKGYNILGECGPRKPVAAKRPLTASESINTTALGAITPTQVQDNLGPIQVSLSPRSQRSDTLQPPQSPGVGTVDCDNCRTARGPAAFPPNRSHGNEKRRQRGRRVRRTRWFLFRIWRKRGGHGRSPWRAKIQLCQTYAVLSGEKGGAAPKAPRRVFVAFSSFAVLSCSARSSPTVNISQGFARMVEQFTEKCCLFFLSSAKVLVLLLPANRCLHSNVQFGFTSQF